MRLWIVLSRRVAQIRARLAQRRALRQVELMRRLALREMRRVHAEAKPRDDGPRRMGD
ncbi:MAG TPA: hypothetical protein VGF35_02020 [Steroidobacteraceae bacterium]